MYTPKTLIWYRDLSSTFPDVEVACLINDFAHQFGDFPNLEEAINEIHHYNYKLERAAYLSKVFPSGTEEEGLLLVTEGPPLLLKPKGLSG